MTVTRPASIQLHPLQLAASSALSPFAMVIVSPLLPDLARLFSAPAGEVQFVISAYLAGLCLAQLVLGALSDRFGRRSVLLVSLVVYVATSIACAFAPDLEWLIAARFLQACGAAGSAAVSRAAVHDVHRGDAAIKAMSTIASAHSLSHMLAPLIGGWLAAVFGVTGVFLFLSLMGAAMIALTYRLMPETKVFNPAAHRFGVGHLLANYWIICKSPVFLCYAMMYGLAGSAFFAYLAVAPAYFAENFGTSGAMFGAYWSLMSVAFFFATMATGPLVVRLGRRGLLWLGVGLTFAIGAVWPIVGFMEPTVFNLIAPPVAMSGTLGLLTGLTLSGAIGAQPQLAGTASGLCGALSMAIAAAFTVAAGMLYNGTALALIWPLSLGSVLMLLAAVAVTVVEKPGV